MHPTLLYLDGCVVPRPIFFDCAPPPPPPVHEACLDISVVGYSFLLHDSGMGVLAVDPSIDRHDVVDVAEPELEACDVFRPSGLDDLIAFAEELAEAPPVSFAEALPVPGAKDVVDVLGRHWCQQPLSQQRILLGPFRQHLQLHQCLLTQVIQYKMFYAVLHVVALHKHQSFLRPMSQHMRRLLPNTTLLGMLRMLKVMLVVIESLCVSVLVSLRGCKRSQGPGF